MVQNATQYGLRARALDAKWSNRKVYSSEHLAQPAAEATVAAGAYELAHHCVMWPCALLRAAASGACTLVLFVKTLQAQV